MAKRKPVAKKRAKKASTKKPAKKPKAIRKNPVKEYREMMVKTGVAKVSQLSNDECISNIPGRVSTGCLALDRLMRAEGEPDDWFGIPLSRIIEIYGPPQIGKSSIADQIMAQVQKIGGAAVLADTERSRDRFYTRNLGVDIDALHYLEYAPKDTFVENVLEDLERTAVWYATNYPHMPVIMVWDALGSTATQDEMRKGILGSSSIDKTDKDAKIKTHKPGAAAKAMALAQRIVAPKLAGTKIGWIFLNHEYENINTRGSFGPTKKSYGGNAPKHMASSRIQLYSKGNIIKRADGWVMGREIIAKLAKDRFGNAMKEAVIPMITGAGTENLYTILTDLKKLKVITSSGSWSAVNIDGIAVNFQGWNGLRAKCNEIPELEDKLVKLHRTVVV